MTSLPPQLSSFAPAVWCAAGGAAWAFVFPRGPQDGSSVAVSVAGALLVGGFVGRWGGGRRWLGIIAAWVACELVRWPFGVSITDLPLAHLAGGSQYALGELAFGRGVDLVVGLLPLAVGLRFFRGRPTRSRGVDPIGALENARSDESVGGSLSILATVLGGIIQTSSWSMRTRGDIKWQPPAL